MYWIARCTCTVCIADGWWEKWEKSLDRLNEIRVWKMEKKKLKSEKKPIFFSFQLSHHHQLNIWLTAMDRERKSSKWIEIQNEKKKSSLEKMDCKRFFCYLLNFSDLIPSRWQTTNEKVQTKLKFVNRNFSEQLLLLYVIVERSWSFGCFLISVLNPKKM